MYLQRTAKVNGAFRKFQLFSTHANALISFRLSEHVFVQHFWIRAWNMAYCAFSLFDKTVIGHSGYGKWQSRNLPVCKMRLSFANNDLYLWVNVSCFLEIPVFCSTWNVYESCVRRFIKFFFWCMYAFLGFVKLIRELS